ncbi:MAG: hypothetical protein WCE46_06395 [Methanoregula sp.]|jgi:hypothetical protein|uniref:hypothetical protein n=1 Tax=Methanoregula sp. TaxID=2052170 RepID=UPI003C733B1F
MKTKLLIIAGLLVIAFAVMITPVMAGNTATVTANPSKVISVTVNGGITNWALDPTNSPKIDASDVTLTVSSNDPGWTVAVKDALDQDTGSNSKPNAGYLVDYNTNTNLWGTTHLGSPLKVESASVTGITGNPGSPVILSNTDQTIETGASDSTGTGTFTTTPLTFTQPVAYTDQVLGSNHVYRIIVTFTGTAT